MTTRQSARNPEKIERKIKPNQKQNNVKMKKLYILVAALAWAATSFAQQNPVFNQYIFNPMTVNPAYAGSKQWTNVNTMYATQWVGMDGAPQTLSVSIEGPVLESMGLGLQYVNDRIGAQTQQGLYGNYAYRLKLNEKWRLSLGLAVGISYFTLDGTQLQSDTDGDPAVPVNKVNTLRFDPKTGIFVYSDRFYAGLSVTDLLGNLIDSPDGLVNKQERHYYLTAGYVFDIGKDVKIKPSFMIREDFAALTNIDVSTFALFRETFWIGATYRFGADIMANPTLDNSLRKRDALVFMTEWNITKYLMVGYAYTYSLTALSNFSGHEITLDYTLSKKVDSRMSTPRFF